jgi:hypothetical protein
LDRYGFVRHSQDALEADDLFSNQLVLVVAPPWTGKSFVAKQLEAHFRQHMANVTDHAPFGTFFHLTNFERHVPEDAFPAWWGDWRRCESRACWLVDAVDEDAKDHSRGAQRVLGLVSGLTSHERARLCLLIFARENEVPKKVGQWLREIYGDPGKGADSAFERVRLAPLDFDSAQDFVGDDEVFARVRDLITSNRLQSIAGFPSVLDRLKRYGPDEPVTSNQVWRDVVADLIRDKNADPGQLPDRTTIDEQFRAASRLAAILTFGDCEAIDDGHGTTAQPSVDALVRRDHAEAALLNRAAREVLHSTIFRRTLGGLRFTQHHVQQWLAAYGVANLSLVRLRPLVVDATGTVAERHAGVLGLLVNTTSHADVRDWIVKQYGGIPPRPDAAPWDLGQALAALDRLQAISKKTTWGLSLWDDRGLERLASPGLGRELARRLADRALTNQERELLIDVAQAVGSTEAVSAAMTVARDSTEDGHLRVSAITLALLLGSKKDWVALGDYVRTLSPTTGDEISIKSSVVQWMYDKNLWDFATALRETPPPDSRTNVLHYRLMNDMTLDDARAVLKELELEAFLRQLAAEGGGPRRRQLYRRGESVMRAIELVRGQASPSDDDLRLLIPVAVSLDRPEWLGGERPYLSATISGSRSVRRELVEQMAGRAPSGRDNFPWHVAQALAAEDAAWLTELAARRGADHPWLWDLLLRLVEYDAVPPDVRDAARAKVEEALPGEVKRHDDGRAEVLRRQKESEDEAAKARDKREADTFELAQLVDDTVASATLTLKEKAMQLSWFCLVGKAYRPTNVTGDWADLGDARQAAVLAIAERALRGTDPTPVPDGTSYSAWIVYEAACFSRVLELRGGAFPIDADLVLKWLPGVVAFYDDVRDETMLRCHAAAPDVTEDVLFGELRRRLRSDPGGTYFIEQLPDGFWSARFAVGAARLAADEAYSVAGRARILRTLAVRARDLASPILAAWLGSADENERTAGIDLALCVDPDAAWPVMRNEVKARGKPAILSVRSLHDRFDGLKVDFTTWRAEILEDLIRTLMELFPSSEDPARESGDSAGIEDAYRDLRKSLPNVLLTRGAPDDMTALGRLAAQFPALKTWLDARLADREAGAVVAKLGPDDVPAGPGIVPWEKVSKAIEGGVYRVLRTAEDLQAVLIEELERIRADAKEHLSLLYDPRKGRKSNGGAAEQKTLQEDALQAYFYCRLSDRLGRVLDAGTKVIIVNREPLATKDQRLDIKVQAPTVGGTVATVVIELKWSDNPGVSTSLVEQLTKEYLAGSGLTHGIYLVGWSKPGPWKDTTVPGPADTKSLDAWRNCFLSQARAATKAYPGTFVVPIIVDLAWPPSESVKRSAKASGGKSARSSKGRLK